MSSQSPSRRQSGPSVVPFFGGAALAVGGFFAARAATKAYGYGDDVHALRVAALCVPLFVAGIFAFWPGWRFLTRVVFFTFPFVLGVAGWVYAPSRPDGLSLSGAAKQRDELKARLAQPPGYDDTGAAAELSRRVDLLAREYPALSEEVRRELGVWIDQGTRTIVEKFEGLSPDDPAAAREVRDRAADLGEAYPAARPTLDDACRGWVDRAARARTVELGRVGVPDDGFDRTAPARHALAADFPEARDRLVAVERDWALGMAEMVVDVMIADGKSPREVRDLCRGLEAQLLALKGLEDSKARFLAARRKLFAAAHQAARAQVREHIENRQFGLAFTVAVSHDLEWAATTPLLSADEQKGVAELRESCRYLAKLSERAGELPEVAPEPRSKP